MTYPLLSPSNSSALLHISSTLNSSFENTDALAQALTCSGLLTNCSAICPNPDLAGIGVRVAFYFQSLVTALLVIFSPTDSVPTAWAGTLLTTALVVAAIVQKAQGNLTLHHATLVLNYATLSCISSLAVAPVLPIWKLSPSEYYRQEQDRHAITLVEDEHIDQALMAAGFYTYVLKKRLKESQTRARVVLSGAILLQVVLQWGWGIYLFVSPSYSQPSCSGDTILVMFMYPFRTRDINNLENATYRYLIWPLWLLFCLGITLTLTILLALSSRPQDDPSRSFVMSAGTRQSAGTPPLKAWTRLLAEVLSNWKEDMRQSVFWLNFVSLGLWVMFVAASEWQPLKNRIFSGENNFGGLGQITAVGVSVVPLWSLCVALYKYPKLRSKQKRHNDHRAMQAGVSRRNSQDLTPPDPSAQGTDGSSGHAAHPSDATMVSPGSDASDYDQNPSLYGALFSSPYRALPTSSPPGSPGSPFTTSPPSPGMRPAVTLSRRHGHAAQSSDEQFELKDMSRVASSSSHVFPSVSSPTLRRVPAGPRPRSVSSPDDHSP